MPCHECNATGGNSHRGGSPIGVKEATAPAQKRGLFGLSRTSETTFDSRKMPLYPTASRPERCHLPKASKSETRAARVAREARSGSVARGASSAADVAESSG